MPRVPFLCWILLFASGCDSLSFRQVQIKLEDPEAAQAVDPRAEVHLARTLRFSVAAVESPRDTFASYSRLFERLGHRLGMPIEFVQESTYARVNELLVSGRVDAALVCTGGYLALQHKAPGISEILAIPLVEGKPTYESLVIVRPGVAETLDGLRGKRFAFTDELSLSGHLYLRRALRQRGHDPNAFFGLTVFTQSHDRSVNAVASGVVDGAAVHSGVLRHLVGERPGLAAQVEVIHRSQPFGAMPVVSGAGADAGLRARIRAALLSLHEDEVAGEYLRVLGFDRFTLPAPGLYDTAKETVEATR